ncbi:UNVERIFIED_CONTAM: hypothetical protein PYX00_002748 [Menopon gallinae]|uniref:26S proteasome non-ATPase regulatory subunit 13 n=1 Tax=Menopon gallinae TaxID=328185 RepID=A0AAW2HYF8_9NEOP
MAGPYVKDSVSQYLSAKQSESSKELVTEWADLEELYNKKLWHQLTLKLEQFVKNPALHKGDSLIQLYKNFISVFENRINPLSLVEIVAQVVTQYNDPNEAVDFLKKVESKVKSSIQAVTLCKVLIGQILLDKLNDQTATKQIIEDVEKLLDEIDGVTTVHGRYYLLAAQYYKLQAKHADYYRTALRYLGCVELSTLSNKEQTQHAFYLGLAALLGETVYNLGELLTHPILETLKSTEEAWLVELLCAFNSGDIAKFDKMKPKWSSIPDLAAEERRLRQKISLLCLMEMTFKRSSNNRQLTFEEIAAEAKLPVNEVELLVMKALAQGLVRGAIDQVSSTVTMTWVQPRVLDKSQIRSMVQRLDSWCKDVALMENLLETKGCDFVTL